MCTKTNIPKYLIKQIWDEFKKATHIKKEALSTFFPDEVRESTIQELYNQTYENEDLSVVLRTNRKRVNQTKKRWAKTAISNYYDPSPKKEKEILAEYRHLLSYYESYGEEKFRELYSQDHPKEIIEKKIEQLEEWSQDTHSLISNYPYLITDKTKNQIKKAISEDLVILIGDIILRVYDGKVDGVIVERPISFVNNPIFANETETLEISDEAITREGDNLTMYHYNDYMSPEGQQLLRILIPKEYVQQSTQIRALDGTDLAIFIEVMKQRTNIFATQRKIFVNIGKIVKNAFNSDGVKNYKLVQSRLLKLFNVRVNTFDGTRGFGFFDYIDINTDTWIAEITINEHLYQDYLKQQTVQMYRDEIERFELAISKNLVYILQQERFLCHSGGHSYIQKYGYSFFAHKLRLKSRSKYENYQIIEASLEEIIKHNVAVKSFKRTGEQFEIEYLEVSQYEIEDLMHIPNFDSPTSTKMIELQKPTTI
ncbi:hypothetical protein SFC65_24440 [Priestia filamentosa]|uniref:hypothetical protein n=1 Tax=Priestia filamentosa TaxID=1402861 RepID=UPI003982B2EB